LKRGKNSSAKRNLGKITVKHFLNTALKQAEGIVSMVGEDGQVIEFPAQYPLYIKITFKRMTTQLKSIVSLNFASVEEAFEKYGTLMILEKYLITDIIEKEYIKSGDKFKMKGIADKAKPYCIELFDFFSEKCFINEYKKVILKSRSIYMRLLLPGVFDVSLSVYYAAAKKLLENPDELIELNAKFEIVEKFRQVIKQSNNPDVLLIEWIYGKGKEEFTHAALSAGLSFGEIVTIVAEIDKQIETIV